MALDTFVAVPYVGTFNAVNTGITESGYELTQESNVQDIAPSDIYGDSVIDSVYRGGQVFMQFESKTYKAGALTPYWGWNTTVGNHGVVGQLASDQAAAMVLTVVAGPTTAGTPTTLTASKALIAANFPARLLFSSQLRTVPVRLRLYPYVSTNLKWFAIA